MRLAVLPLALLVATPAAAQIVINGSHQADASQRERSVPMQRQGWSGELNRVHRDTNEARRNGDITRREARSIHRQERLIWSVGSTYALNGLSDAELQALDSQAFALRDLARAPNRPAPPSRRGH